MEDTIQGTTSVRFASFELDVRSRELCHGGKRILPSGAAIADVVGQQAHSLCSPAVVRVLPGRARSYRAALMPAVHGFTRGLSR